MAILLEQQLVGSLFFIQNAGYSAEINFSSGCHFISAYPAHVRVLPVNTQHRGPQAIVHNNIGVLSLTILGQGSIQQDADLKFKVGIAGQLTPSREPPLEIVGSGLQVVIVLNVG